MVMGFDRVCVVGLGYVGLPTAAMFAARGIRVHGVDLRESIINRVNSGQSHIIEPDLDIVLQSVVSTGMLKASTKVEPADAFIIAVPTPIMENTAPDMRYVESALSSIAPVVRPGNLIIIESTSPVGTTQRAAEQLQRVRSDLTWPHTNPEKSDVLLCYCPERILPGNTLRELSDNARLVGGLDRRSADRGAELYSVFAKGAIHKTSAPVAEMVKLTENAFRDVNIAFANEVSLICDSSGIDAWEVIKLANLHPRVNILEPGPGVGGHCIPVDPWFIVHSEPKLAQIIRTARQVNHAKQDHVRERIQSAARQMGKASISILGLAYKPNVDDLRESPAVAIAEELVRSTNHDVYLVEPNVDEPPKQFAGNARVHWVNLQEALEKGDIIALLVAHRQFTGLDRAKLSGKKVIDCVGVLR
jgi:UDP-N-acetyl-D-mannosaminuronic acid dehydrogenase